MLTLLWNEQKPGSCIRLLLLLQVLVLANLFGADNPRLFTDLMPRFPVGDTNATNPLRRTEGPKTLVTADLNRDGLADVITGNLDGSLSILNGLTNGNLATQILVRATGLLSNSSIRALAVGDFNGDGFTDVVAGDVARYGVVTLLGNAAGGLVPTYRLEVGPARALAVADFNHDHKLDLLVGTGAASEDISVTMNTNPPAIATNHSLFILRGNGDGSFQPPQYVMGPNAQAFFYDVATTDINQDGSMDIVALDYSWWWVATNALTNFHRALIFTNLGNGAFTTNVPQRVLQTSGYGPRAMLVACLDETTLTTNGTPDILIANCDNGTLDLFLNRGNLNFDLPRILSVKSSPRDVAVGDLNHDGWPDLVVVDRNSDKLRVLRGYGGGNFETDGIEYPTGVSPRNVVLADINGDNLLDAVANNRESEDVSVFLGATNLAGFLVPVNFYPAGLSPVSVVVADFNQDGADDIATASLRTHDVRVRLNNGSGKFGAELILPVNYNPAFLAAGDLNNDGKADILVSCLGMKGGTALEQKNALVVLLGRGDGTFDAPVVTAFADANFQPYWLRLGDLSGDGKLDAVVGGMTGSLLAFRGLGNGSFATGVAVGMQADGRSLGIALADFDHDGRLDIACSHGKIFLNNGEFFSGANWSGNVWTGPTRSFLSGDLAWAMEAEDLDNDGEVDLVVAMTFVRPDPIYILYGMTNGSFTTPREYSGPDFGAVAIKVCDLDGDHIKDLVIGDRCNARVMTIRGQSNRVFQAWESIRSLAVEDVEIGDFNRDGKPDLVGVGVGVWPIINGGSILLGRPEFSLIGQPQAAGVYINELMSRNQSFFVTNGAMPDWVELYNYQAVTQHLTGWSLAQIDADGVTNTCFFTNEFIPPFGHLVVFCSQAFSNINAPKAPFELSADGETLALYAPGHSLSDSVHFPPLPTDVSYARVVDGGRYFCMNPTPTMGNVNGYPANLLPTISKKEPYIGPGGSAFGLTARVFDDVAASFVAVGYRVAGQANAAFTELSMTDDGRQGDKLAGDSFYGALLPTLPPGTQLEYYLRVVDLEGQVGYSPDNPDDIATLHRVTVPLASSALRLSELVAANTLGLRDEAGQYEDWVELVNTGPVSINLNEYALGKNPLDATNAWIFPPGVALSSGQYQVVICDNDSGTNLLHANFKLNRDGDRIYLFQRSTGQVIDSLAFNSMPSDTSFGIVAANAEAQVLAWPTPGTANIAVPPPRFPPSTAPELLCRFDCLAPGANRGFHVRWQSYTNRIMSVQWSTNLIHWSNSVPPVHLGQGIYQWSDVTVSNAPRAYYRVISY